MDRRAAIRTVGTLAVPAVAGCSSLRRLTCPTPIEAAVGSVSIVGRGDYNPRIGETVEQGTVTVRITNQADDYSVFTESKELYDVQERVEEGWRSIYCVTSKESWDREEVEHEPGTGFTWELTTDTANEREAMRLREAITSGTYRFVYFGLVEPELQGSGAADERAIAVEFDVPP